MNNQYKHIINQGESETVEYKTSFSDEVIISLVAFANTKGGTVYIGVSDKGQMKGVDIGKETVQNWVNEIKVKTQPSIIPTITEHKLNNKVCVEIRVQEFPIKPLSFKGRYYKRVNNSNQQLNASEISDLNLQTLQVSWDSYPSTQSSIDDIDWKKVDKFVNKVNDKGRVQKSHQ